MASSGINMDQVKELLEKIPVAPIVLAAAIWYGYDVHSFINDESSDYKQKLVQIELAKDENKKIVEKVKQAEAFYKTLDAKKVQLREMASRLDEMKSTLTEDLDIAEFIKMTVTEANKVGLNVK